MFIENIFTQQNINSNLFIKSFKEFEVVWNQMVINGYTFTVPILHLSEEEIKYKGLKFITIATLNGDISTKLKKVYKVLEEFYIQYSDILCPLIVLWNIKMNSSLEQQLINEYNCLRNDYLRNKWKIDVYKKYTDLKLQQIRGRMLSATELWNIIDLDWIEQIKATYYPIQTELIDEEKKESTDIQDKINREELSNEAQELVPCVPLEDVLSEQLIAQMMEEMVLQNEEGIYKDNFDEKDEEEKYSAPLQEQKVMRLIDDEEEEEKEEEEIENDSEVENRKRILRCKTVSELRMICKNNGIHPIPKLKNELVNSISVRFGIYIE
jgi:hypothetical protein